MTSASNTQDDYILGRNITSRIRLNNQHFMFPKIFGYLLHPSVPRGENLKIADVATGSGIWLLDLMSELPASTSYHGLDIDLSLTPPREWLPPNIHFTKFDLENEVPTELESVFDVINIRLLLFVVKQDDPTQILGKAMRMLKPGGWLQWTEAGRSGRALQFHKTSSDRSHTEMQNLFDRMVPNDPRFRPSWPARLKHCFEAVGFAMVESDIKDSSDYLPWVAFSSDCSAAVFEEIILRLPLGPHRNELEDLYGQAARDSWDGVAWDAARINVIGRKPSVA